MKKEERYFYKYHFKKSTVLTSNHPDIQTKTVAEALNIHPFMLSRCESPPVKSKYLI